MHEQWARLAPGWNRFWFDPVPTSTLALVRIAYGLVLLAWCGFMSFDLVAFFSGSGVLPERLALPWTWSLLEAFPSDLALFILFALLVVAAACVLVGWHTRLAAVVAFVALVSFERRNLVVLNGADILLRLFALYLALAPAGASFSLDRWRHHRDRFWEFPARSPWPLRLVQLQLSVLYLSTVWLKLQGTTWRDGTAVSYAWRVAEVIRFDLPAWLTSSAPVMALATYLTLAVEVALAVLIWNRRARPWVIAAGVALHLSVLATIRVGLFSVTVFVGYLAFTRPETATRWLLALRKRLGHARSPVLRRVAAAGSCPGHQPDTEPATRDSTAQRALVVGGKGGDDPLDHS